MTVPLTATSRPKRPGNGGSGGRRLQGQATSSAESAAAGGGGNATAGLSPIPTERRLTEVDTREIAVLGGTHRSPLKRKRD